MFGVERPRKHSRAASLNLATDRGPRTSLGIHHHPDVGDEKDEEFRRRRLEREAAGEQTNLLQRPEAPAEGNVTTNSQAKSSDSSAR